jgi:hypothetical protein
MERELIMERTIAGLAAASAESGNGGGRKSVMTSGMLDTATICSRRATSPPRWQSCCKSAARPSTGTSRTADANLPDVPSRSATEEGGVIRLLEPTPANPRHVVDPLESRGRTAGVDWVIIGAGQQHEAGNGHVQQELLLGPVQSAQVQPGQSTLALGIGKHALGLSTPTR